MTKNSFIAALKMQGFNVRKENKINTDIVLMQNSSTSIAAINDLYINIRDIKKTEIQVSRFFNSNYKIYRSFDTAYKIVLEELEELEESKKL